MVYSQEQIKSIMARLSEPFDPAEVKWRVTNKSRDGKNGMVAPYADPRAYNTRLNSVLGYEGWEFKLTTSTTMGLTRKRGSEVVPTGKVTVVATLSIFGISEKASTGEMWADDDNAVTRAEAQAKKRACAMFGLGEYFYAFKEISDHLWVPLDNYGKPTRLPRLPAWALPSSYGGQAQPSNGDQKSALGIVQSTQTQPQTVARDQKWFDAQIRTRQVALGDALCKDIIHLVSSKMTSGALKGNLHSVTIEKLDAAVSLLNKVRAYAENLSIANVDALLAKYQTRDFGHIATFTTLYFMAADCGVVPALVKRAA